MKEVKAQLITKETAKAKSKQGVADYVATAIAVQQSQYVKPDPSTTVYQFFAPL